MLVLQDAAKPGSKVKKGEVVAEFDRQYMMQRLDDYRASVAQIEASIRKLEAELKVDSGIACADDRECEGGSRKSTFDVKTIPVLGRIDAERTRLAAEEAEARYKQLLAEVKFVEIGQQSQLKNARARAAAGACRIETRGSQCRPHADQGSDRRSGRDAEHASRHASLRRSNRATSFIPGMMFMQIVDPSSMMINATSIRWMSTR